MTDNLPGHAVPDEGAASPRWPNPKPGAIESVRVFAGVKLSVITDDERDVVEFVMRKLWRDQRGAVSESGREMVSELGRDEVQALSDELARWLAAGR